MKNPKKNSIFAAFTSKLPIKIKQESEEKEKEENQKKKFIQ